MLDINDARKLIDFSGGKEEYEKLGEEQLKATVSLYNMMMKNGGLGYLADEVGMGKTYIALGIVSLLRYLNPNLKVLYILPKQNVLDKWKKKEYKNFLENNIKVQNHKVKSFNSEPASSQVECKDLTDLIKYSSVGYYGDFFIKMSSFSFPLSDDKKSLKNKLKSLEKLIPSLDINNKNPSKEAVKIQYSQAINKILPQFDLVIIDEAHNFRKSMDSSARNEYLSIVLGTSNNQELIITKKIDKVLLLSATPYDRNIEQLKNQLTMVGMTYYANLLHKDLSKEKLIEILKQFMVRRLNRLVIEKKEFTRNQYRVEERDTAAIELESIDKKLIVALVQKKVGELLNDDKFKGQFETGMLASFESYLPSTRKKDTAIESEYDNTEGSEIKTAVDNNIITHLHTSYTKRFMKTSMPHPKMDSVVDKYISDMLVNGKKHIIFVRRIQSVTDLKTKFDEGYDKWLLDYLKTNIHDYKTKLESIVNDYSEVKISQKSNVDNESENSSNTFFTYYFRGQNENKAGTPFDIKDKLNTVSKDDKLINIFEVNWFHVFKDDIDFKQIKKLVNKYWMEYSEKYTTEKKKQKLTKNEKFLIIQTCYLELIGKEKIAIYYRNLFNIRKVPAKDIFGVSDNELNEYLNLDTFFSFFENLFSDGFLQTTDDNIDKVDFIVSVISSILRLGHGVIDIYIAYTNDSNHFLANFITILQKQKEKNTKFCTYQQLLDTIKNIDLIIRNNFADYSQKENSFTKYIGSALAPLEGIVGARGGSGSKSAIARKFRMPGYPMILISTDVLQEGEDLHTFCDSVIHYGLANSPIAIEQKNGRVDRIGSLAQRNLQEFGFMENENMLKVSFPFLQESVEVVQICNISKNLNDYIKSINSFESKNYSTTNDSTTFDMQIEPQIMEKLASPFKAVHYSIPGHLKDHRLTNAINEDAKKVEKVLDYVKGLIEPYKNDSSLTININIAKSSSMFLLEIIKKSGIETFSTKKDFLTYMKRHSYDVYHRTIAKVINQTTDSIGKVKGEITCDISYDIQILVGDETITHELEINEAFHRIKGAHHLSNDKYTLIDIYAITQENLLSDQEFIRNRNVELTTTLKEDSIILIFDFHQNELLRKQEVTLSIVKGYLIFESHVTKINYVETIDMEDIIKHTWQRNNYIDIVEFVINDEGAIIARIAFPCIDIQNKEILYNSYLLACESDHLEQILHRDDRF